METSTYRYAPSFGNLEIVHASFGSSETFQHQQLLPCNFPVSEADLAISSAILKTFKFTSYYLRFLNILTHLI